MAKLSDYLTKKFKDGQKIKEVCFNCKYINRPNQDKPFQSELNEAIYCDKLNKFIENINSNSCGYFEYF